MKSIKNDVLDVLYIHSPITRSIAHQMEKNGDIHTPLVICGRKTTWHDAYVEVTDNGMWDIDRTCDFLEKLVKALPHNDHLLLDVYLPHTGFLLGKLLKLSPLVRRFFYIEEGDTASDPAFTQPVVNVAVSVDTLYEALSVRGISGRLRLGPGKLQNINAMPVIFFDGHDQKYGGSFRISDDAYLTLPNVQKVRLEAQQPIPEAENVWVCMLPNIINMVAENQVRHEVLQKLLYGLIILIRTARALAECSSAILLLKFHPNDECNLNAKLKSDILSGAYSYMEFFQEHHLDPNFEPALYNFGKYIVINKSAASRYVSQIRGEDKLIRIALN